MVRFKIAPKTNPNGLTDSTIWRKNMKKEITPRNSLRVFVSSAQRREGDFDWEEVRARIVEKIRTCPFLSPFIMEESGSELPSVQRFTYKVEQSDIVILLVKGDVREGTAIEASTAMSKKKPMLIFFLEDDNPSYKVKQLKREIASNDYCSYHKIKSLDRVEDQVFQDLIENVIEFYQYKHYSLLQQDGDLVFSADSLDSDTQLTNAPTKATFSLFESAYDYIYDLLSLEYLKRDKTTLESDLHGFGKEALEWLILGANWLDGDGVLDLSEKAKDIYGKTNWFLKRWDAIKNALSGDFDKALDDENEALNLAKDSNAPGWVINDILVDCRNLTIIAGNAKNQLVFDSPAQKELNESETIVYLPITDRYLENMYAEMLKEEISIEISPPSTIHYGSNISHVIHAFENYFFSSILYGSYTHISLSREVLADVLYKYAAISSYPELLLQAVKLYVLSGNSKKLKQVLDSKWDSCYSGIASEADSYWLLSNSIDAEKKGAMKQTIISKLGLYFSDTVFNEASIFLEEQLPGIYWGNCEDYLQCILDNITRIKPELVIRILIHIIENKKYRLGHKVTSILMCLNLESVPQEDLIALHDALFNSLPSLIKNNGDPQCIAALVGQCKEIFSDLAELPNNGLEGDQKLYYDLNMGGDDYDQLYENLINMAREQYNTNSSGNGFTSFAVQPYSSISSLMRKGKYFTETAEKEFFSLCNDVLSSQVPIPVKDDCVACLCDIIIERVKRSMPIPQELSPIIPFLEEQGDNSFYFMRTTTLNTFLSRVLFLKVLMGIENEDEIIGWNTILKKGDPNERVVIAKCCEKYLQFITCKGKEPSIAVLSIAIQCTEDDYHPVRQYGSNCMCYFLGTKYHEQAENKLYELALDSSHWVRNHLINLCANGMINDEIIKTKLIETLKNDANYRIRVHASSCNIQTKE